MKLSAFDWVEARELIEGAAFFFMMGFFIGCAITICVFVYFG